MIDRRSLLLGGAGLGAAALGGCAGFTGQGGGEASRGQTTLTFVNWSGDAEKAASDALISRFEEANPDIRVETQTVPYADISTNIDSRFQAGDPPDLFRVSYIDIGLYTSQGVLLDLSETIGARAGEFVPGLYEAVVVDQVPYGVPHQIDTTAVLYRTDAFEAAGITDVPTGLEQAWSWAELAEVAERLKGVTGADQYPFVYNWQAAGAYRWLSWLFQAGGRLLTRGLDAAAVASDEGRRAVEFTQRFFTEEWVARNTSTQATTYASDEFVAGTAAMAFVGDFSLPTIDTGADFEYGVLPMPRDVEAASDLGGNAVVAAADGPNTGAAARFCAFIAEEEQMRRYCEATGQLPTLTALTETELAFEVRPDLMPTFVEQATTLTAEQVRQVTVPAFGRINALLGEELEQAFLGGRDAAATVDALAAAVDGALG
ncbi:sugar ABC transporter substrate-binding protein [Desertihabitans brevis]|uniref:Sugar ABC transporter substrate-binding protein n=1 Tax=Desertihabitans brevis TaxID=2268447 RepID=A0A367YTW6_9ACTN|nr:sugar ABC transporter substrate-binding protein [Desertihabitans brevis]RCK69333.1 sugar ABC transporter substrate-binding protein [Desertihabitans brevis]